MLFTYIKLIACLKQACETFLIIWELLKIITIAWLLPNLKSECFFGLPAGGAMAMPAILAAVHSIACRISGCFTVCLSPGPRHMAEERHAPGWGRALGRKRWNSDSLYPQIASPVVHCFTQQHKQCLGNTVTTDGYTFSLANSVIWRESKFELTFLSSISGLNCISSVTKTWWWKSFSSSKARVGPGTYPSSWWALCRGLLRRMSGTERMGVLVNQSGECGGLKARWPAYQKLKREAQSATHPASDRVHRLAHLGEWPAHSLSRQKGKLRKTTLTLSFQFCFKS